jgi:uncharacterized protein
LEEMKAFALFSLLFGIGLAIQFERSSARGSMLPLLTRRLLALLLIGIIHLTLIWNGDILTEYAIAGFIALLFLFTSKMWLGIFSLLFASAYVILPYLNLPLPSLNPAWIHVHLSQANVVYKYGTFRQILSFEFHELPELLPLHIYVLPRTVALFLFGAFSWRSGVVKRLGSHLSLLAGVAFFCLLVGIPLTILTSRLAPSWRLILGRGSDALSMIGEMALAIGYAGTILSAATTKWGERLLGWAAPLGRMAFTNYLLQSVIFSAVFFGWGLGWYGMSAGPALLIGIIVYVVQVFVSAAWLRRYRFGPVEWLWRTMMYGYMQPLKRRHQ